MQFRPQTALRAGSLESWVCPNENNSPCKHRHLSFFCKVRAIMHTGHVPGTAGSVSLTASPFRRVWLEESCSKKRRSKSVVKFKVYQK